MLVHINYTVSPDLLQEAIDTLPNFDHRIDLNVPTNDFFYDNWVISPQFKDTVWERILDTLPIDIGQARLMKLEPGTCYRSHADADDRYHLTLVGNQSYLVDLDNQEMHQTVADGNWYLMDASRRHSAVNFGGITRVQLVIRKLLTRGLITNPTTVEIGVVDTSIENFRYIFDDVFSPWINQKNRTGSLDDFKIIADDKVSFTIDCNLVNELSEICPQGFKINEC